MGFNRIGELRMDSARFSSLLSLSYVHRLGELVHIFAWKLHNYSQNLHNLLKVLALLTACRSASADKSSETRSQRVVAAGGQKGTSSPRAMRAAKARLTASDRFLSSISFRFFRSKPLSNKHKPFLKNEMGAKWLCFCGQERIFMLSDEVYASLPREAIERQLIAEAHKIVLTDEFLQAASNIGKTNEDCVALKHLFRLPHNPLWLESRPKDLFNCGLYLIEMSQEECADLKRRVPGLEPFNSAIRVSQVPVYPNKAFSWIFLPDTLYVAEDGKLSLNIVCYEELPVETQILLSRDSSIYCRYIATLNSRNLIEVESTDLTRLNRSRQRRGKLPLFDHKVVRINRDIRQMIRDEAHSESNDASGIRTHWRRGHFKVRKTGVFWWSPHIAGKPELGQIEKKYVA